MTRVVRILIILCIFEFLKFTPVKHILSVIVAIWITGLGYGQLTNGSFENYHQLPQTLGNWSSVIGWTNAGSTEVHPDYYHTLGNVVTDLPETPMAIVHPFEGDAIMGISICTKNGANKREYLQTKFSHPLTVGQEYHLSFRMTSGERTSSSLSGLAVNHIGALLSTLPVSQNGASPIEENPQFVIEDVFYNSSWQLFSFSFIAIEPFEYLTFGLFHRDFQHTFETSENPNAHIAYCFVDDFKLDTQPIDDTTEEPSKEPIGEKITPNAPFFVPNAFTPNNDSDNDIFKPIPGTVKDWILEVYTKWGDRVFYTNKPNIGWNGTCSGQPCAVGTYIWKITYKVAGEDSELQVLSEYGFVNLVK